MTGNNKKISLIHKLAYGSGNMLGSGALAISGAWLLYFYTTFCNMSVVKATLIFSIATYLDVILNPLMGFITDSFYRTKLDHKTHKIVIDELDRVHNGGRMEDVTDETRKTVEMLTGIPYESCFGNNHIGYHN